MDLSAVIFVALAVAWALYLIPKALSHHDEIAKTRSIDKFSDSVRVLGRRAPSPAAAASASAAADEEVTGPVPMLPRTSVPPTAAAPVSPVAAPAPRLTRAAARRAAARRRRVLAGLLVVAAVLAGLSYAAITPWWSEAVPGGMIVVFLAVARRTVRRQRSGSVRPTAPVDVREPVADVVAPSHEEQVAAVTMPVEDEGSLWDPLPLTLPTYVGKARARRTVRTIELTDLASSGHDPADSALVARAEAEQARTESTEQAEADVVRRKAAGA